MEFHERKKNVHGIPCPKPRQKSMENFPWNSMEFHGVNLHGKLILQPHTIYSNQEFKCLSYPGDAEFNVPIVQVRTE